MKRVHVWYCLTMVVALVSVFCVAAQPQGCSDGGDCYQLQHVQRRSTVTALPRPPAASRVHAPTVLPSGPGKQHEKHNQKPKPFVLVDMVIVTTLDGSIRAVGRYDGTVYWTIGGSTTRAHSSLVKSSIRYESRLEKSIDDMDPLHRFMDNLDDDDMDDENQTIVFKNSPGASNELSMWKNPVDEGIAYIIEPCDGGVLYKYLDGEPLEKLPFTMKDIVHRARMDDDVIFVGDKVTVVFALDPRYGKVLRKFTLQDSISERHRLPPHTIYIARNEYTVHISDERSNMHWQLAYSEYEPNAMNWNENIDMGTSDVYVAPDANADITAINRTSGNHMWTKPLPFPAVAVYDVYTSMDYAIVLSEQRAPTKLDHGTIGEMLHSLKMRSVNKFNSDASAYVGIHDGALYAMSVKHYPLVQLADWSFQYTKRYPGDIGRWIDASETDVDNGHWCSSPWKGDCMTGLHNISITAVPVPVRPDTSPEDTKADHSTSASSSGTRPDYRHLDYHREGFFYEGLGRFWKLYLLIILGTAYVHRARCHDLYSTHILPVILKLFKKIQSIKKKLRSSSPSANNKRANKKKPASKPSMTMTKQNQDTPDASDASISALSSATSSPAMPLNTEKDTKPLPALPALASRSDDAVPGASLTSGGTTTTTHINGSGGGGNSSWTMISKTGMDLQRFQAATPSTILSISDSVLGYGSHGTVVYKGTFDGRAVAVKRLLIDFYDVAYQEVKLLQESDDHPNVIRYFYKEETDRFLYIALELCLGSLQDCIDRVLPVAEMKLVDHMDPADVLRQMTLGIQHLHSLKIVHRDLKPQNILIAPSKKHLQSTSPLRVLISDFGLCKKLDGDQSSFHYTAASPAGTSGWRAPELLAGALAASISGTSSTSASESSSSALANADSLDPNRIGRVKATRAIDIFSGGCIFYYVLTGGDHPFGNRFGRESNILNGTHDLTKLEGMGEDGMEAMDLIQSMIDPNPKARPTADRVLAHPFFWTPAKRLAFLQDVSDRFEVEPRDPPSSLLVSLESEAKAIIGYDWYRRIDRVVANDLHKFRKYDGRRVRDLLRALRNKKHHWQDLPENVKKTLGEPPDQYLFYFTARFPRLLLHTYHIIASNDDLMHDGALRQYF